MIIFKIMFILKIICDSKDYHNVRLIFFLSWHYVFRSSDQLILGRLVQSYEKFSSIAKVNQEKLSIDSLIVQHSKI